MHTDQLVRKRLEDGRRREEGVTVRDEKVGEVEDGERELRHLPY